MIIPDGFSIAIALRPLYSLILTTILMTVFFALSSWRSYAERERYIAVLDEPAIRPEDFDLQAAWNAITERYEQHRQRFEVQARVQPWTVPALRALGVEVIVADDRLPADADKPIDVTLGAISVEILAAEIAGVMHGIELVDAPEVESVLGEIGMRLVSRFAAVPDR